MRKIERHEIEKVSKLFAEIFADYEAYRLFFPEEKKLARGIEAFFRYEIYASQLYTWVDNDFATGTRALKLAGEYLRFAEAISAKYYDPAHDAYVKNIGVAACARGQGRLHRMLDELCGDLPVYLETHDENNVAIYEHMGSHNFVSTPFQARYVRFSTRLA